MQQQYNQYPPQMQMAPRAPMDKKKIFALIVSICFGVAALFALIAMIGFCVKIQAHAGLIISYIIVVLACTGIALSPIFKNFTKICIEISSFALFLGIYGISMVMISSSFGFFIYMLGFAALACLCWLAVNNNNLVKLLFYVPAAVIFVGALINWIVVKYFTMMKWAVVFYLFDFLFAIVIIGATVILGLYLSELHGFQSPRFNMPNPAPRAPKARPQFYQQPPQQYAQQPQQPQQAQPQQQQYQPRMVFCAQCGAQYDANKGGCPNGHTN